MKWGRQVNSVLFQDFPRRQALDACSSHLVNAAREEGDRKAHAWNANPLGPHAAKRDRLSGLRPLQQTGWKFTGRYGALFMVQVVAIQQGGVDGIVMV